MASDFEVLMNAGITHILNVSSEKIESFPNDFTYHHIPILDLPEEHLIVKLDQCVCYIDSVKDEGRLLVHCMAGISRFCFVFTNFN